MSHIDDRTRVLNFAGMAMRDLPCLLHFKNLRELHIENNELVYLPALPASLEKLYCSNNKLKSLPPLPPGLKILDCSNNPNLSTLPYYNSNVILKLDDTGIDLHVCRGMSPILYKLTKIERFF
jgi:Leucine-rich repeat (LRR) protein